METRELIDIAKHFAIKGTIDTVKPLGCGLINDTYKVTTAEADCPDYVMQKINHQIFQNVDMLMSNIITVTNHIRKRLDIAGEKDLDRKTLTFIPDKVSGKYYYYDTRHYWRIMKFIPDAQTRTGVTPESSKEVGIAFGNFQAMLSDLPTCLGETIPAFHNMEFRLHQLREAVALDSKNRVSEARYYINEIEKRADEMCKGERFYREGILPKRICHCDTKVDNMMFDKDGNVLCVIDLDTVMPNFIFSDFGDFLRSAANTSAEDEKDLDKVSFNFEIFKAFAQGYLQSAKVFLTPLEIENLPFAATLFPYMQCVRFLADYINGDTYYKTQYEGHNLVRTKAQFKLLQSAEAQIPAMKAFIESCL